MVMRAPSHQLLAERRDRYRRPTTGLVGRQERDAQRRDELDGLRLLRRLTEAETAEHDRLIGRLYMREWRRANPPTGATS